MTEPTTESATSLNSCPRCGGQVPAGADECPACEQPLCPECGAAVGEHWSRCWTCGCDFDLLCPGCETVVKPGDDTCPNCGMLLQAEEDEEWKKSPSALPVDTPQLFATGQSIPSCTVCGRHDETLRLAVYPFVFSVLLVTFRRAFSGLWCRKHRTRYWVLASLISSLFGWLGIPFGFIFTPLTLFKLARGGEPLADRNLQLLRALARHKLERGDTEGAIRCLEQALRVQDDDAGRRRLQDLYEQKGPPHYEPSRAPSWPLFLAIPAAAALGIAIGLCDYAVTSGLSALVGETDNLFVVLFTWAPWVSMLFLGGIGLMSLLEWAVRRTACRQMALAIAISGVSALAVLYGTQQGVIIADLVRALLSDELMQGTLAHVLLAWVTLSSGGVTVVWDQAASGTTAGAIYSGILIVAGVYYLAVGVRTVRATVRWQQALATVQARGKQTPARLLQPGWLAIVAAFACLACSIVSFPLWATLSDGQRLGQVSDLVEQGKLDEGVTELEALVEDSADVALSHAALGVAYVAQGEWGQAQDELLTAIELDAELGVAHAMLAGVYYQMGQSDLALQELRQAEELGADDVLTQSILGDMYFWMKDWSSAQDKYQRAIELDPDYASHQLDIADVYAAQGEYESALQACERASELAAEPGEVDSCRATVYLHLLDLAQASRAASEAVAAAPQDSNVHSSLSLVRYLQGDVEGALREAEEAVQLNPYNFSAQEELAFACLARGEPDRALAAAREAIRLRPKHDTAHYLLGLCYRESGDIAGAAEEFEQFLSLYWDRPYAREWRAEAEAFLVGQ